jgi:hypothetical protein
VSRRAIFSGFRGWKADLPALVAVPAGATRTAVVVVPARTAGTARTPAVVRVPVAVAEPVVLVAGLAVLVAVVVAAAPVPDVAPAGVPELARAPVVVGHRPGRPGECLSDARHAHTSKSKTRGDGSRGCNSFDVFHLVSVPRKPDRLNLGRGDFLMNCYE